LKRELKLLYEDLEGEERYSTPWRDTRRQIENVTKEIKDLLKGKI